MVPTFEDLTFDVRREFNGQWGSGRKFVSNDVYAACKKSIEGLSMMPSHRLDEPCFDSYRICLGREFSYTCQSLLTSKRRREDLLDSRIDCEYFWYECIFFVLQKKICKM